MINVRYYNAEGKEIARFNLANMASVNKFLDIEPHDELFLTPSSFNRLLKRYFKQLRDALPFTMLSGNVVHDFKVYKGNNKLSADYFER